MRRAATSRTFTLAILLSLLVHALIFLTMPANEGAAVVAEPRPIEVALLPPPEPKHAPPPEAPAPKQMVAPPDEINDQPPEQPHFESDRDNTVPVETVKEGVPNPAPPPAPKEKAPVKKQPPKPPPRAQPKPQVATDDEEAGGKRLEQKRAHTPALKDLFASTDELISAQQDADQAAKKEGDGPGSGSGRRRLALAVPPVAPDWSLPGARGTLDYLPNIQRGDVTLLNTKANVFAPFVRRVGERVFQHLVIRQRQLELPQIMNARQPVQMKVVLDKRGRLKSVTVQGQSGSASMDGTLSEAVNTAAFDNNPPPTAANADGNYEFIFQAQLRAVQPGAGGMPSRIESRLSVGLL